MLALIRSEPGLGTIRATVESLLAASERNIAERKGRELSRGRLARFQQLLDEAIFCASDFTGMAPETKLRAGRAAARAALEQFGLRPGGPDRLALQLDPKHFSVQEHAHR